MPKSEDNGRALANIPGNSAKRERREGRRGCQGGGEGGGEGGRGGDEETLTIVLELLDHALQVELHKAIGATMLVIKLKGFWDELLQKSKEGRDATSRASG